MPPALHVASFSVFSHLRLKSSDLFKFCELSIWVLRLSVCGWVACSAFIKTVHLSVRPSIVTLEKMDFLLSSSFLMDDCLEKVDDIQEARRSTRSKKHPKNFSKLPTFLPKYNELSKSNYKNRLEQISTSSHKKERKTSQTTLLLWLHCWASCFDPLSSDSNVKLSSFFFEIVVVRESHYEQS